MIASTKNNKKINNKFLKPLVVFDVGAHHGETIRLFLKKLKIEKIYSSKQAQKTLKFLKGKFLKIR